MAIEKPKLTGKYVTTYIRKENIEAAEKIIRNRLWGAFVNGMLSRHGEKVLKAIDKQQIFEE